MLVVLSVLLVVVVTIKVFFFVFLLVVFFVSLLMAFFISVGGVFVSLLVVAVVCVRYWAVELPCTVRWA